MNILIEWTFEHQLYFAENSNYFLIFFNSICRAEKHEQKNVFILSFKYPFEKLETF